MDVGYFFFSPPSVPGPGAADSQETGLGSLLKLAADRVSDACLDNSVGGGGAPTATLFHRRFPS